MRAVRKTIHGSQFKAMLPVTYPALRDGQVSYVTPDTIRKYPNANYGTMPYGVSESISGSFYGFTSQMGSLYSGKVIAYKTIESWWKQFTDYYRLLRGNDCRNVYQSAEEYYTSTHEAIDASELARYGQMDAEHLQHGGDGFYNWLCNYYVQVLDFRTLLSSNDIGLLDYLPNDWLFYPDVIDFYGRMTTWRSRFGDLPCSGFTDCCDCVDYRNMGGSTMCDILWGWLSGAESRINAVNSVVSQNLSSLTPRTTFNLNMTCEAADFGNFEIAPTSGWGVEDENRYASSVLTGRTVSSLDSFKWDMESVDVIGNTIPGHHDNTDGDRFPDKNSFLQLQYQIGRAVNLEKMDNGKYTGDVLVGFRAYCRDEEGNVISGTVQPEKTSNSGVRTSLLDALDALGSTPGYLCADFRYIKGAVFNYSDSGSVSGIENGIGVECTDHCRVDIDSFMYMTSPYESYPVRYFKVTKDIEEVWYPESGEYKPTEMCDFSLNAGAYSSSRYRGDVTGPMIRTDERLYFNGPESIDGDIYVNRGYATALDRFMRLGGVTSLETLENCGNGIFSIRSSEDI